MSRNHGNHDDSCRFFHKQGCDHDIEVNVNFNISLYCIYRLYIYTAVGVPHDSLKRNKKKEAIFF